MGYVISLVGPAKVGKSDFATTAPKPMAYMELDIGGFGRVEWRIKKNHPKTEVVYLKPGVSYEGEWHDDLIIHQNYKSPMQVDSASMAALKNAVKNKITNPANFARVKASGDGKLTGYSNLWYDRFITEYIVFLETGEIKTIVVDSATLMWTLCHTTLLEEKQAVKPDRQSLIEIEYSEANKRMEALIALARECGKNLILIHHTTDKYETLTVEGQSKSMPVGIKHAGWKHVDKFIDLEIWLSVPPISPSQKKAGVKMVPTETITLSGLTLEAQGIAIADASWDKIFNQVFAMRGEYEKMVDIPVPKKDGDQG